MNKLIIDLEATCSDSEEFPREEMEIIEIGAVIVSPEGEVLDKFCTFIKPVRNPVLTEFCTKLTTITQADVDKAPTFKKAMAQLEEWSFYYEPYIFCSWGGYDKNQFNKDCDYHGVKNHLNNFEHVNIKKKFAKAQGVKPCGLRKALNLANLRLLGTLHRGIDDAENMARLVPWIEGDKSV